VPDFSPISVLQKIRCPSAIYQLCSCLLSKGASPLISGEFASHSW